MMKVLSIIEQKKGGAIFYPIQINRHYSTLFVAGLKKAVEGKGVKVMELTIAEADKMKIKAKKSVEFSNDDADTCVKIAILDALRSAMKRKWKPGRKSKK